MLASIWPAVYVLLMAMTYKLCLEDSVVQYSQKLLPSMTGIASLACIYTPCPAKETCPLHCTCAQCHHKLQLGHTGRPELSSDYKAPVIAVLHAMQILAWSWV